MAELVRSFRSKFQGTQSGMLAVELAGSQILPVHVMYTLHLERAYGWMQY
jgi:hypothetical protein